MSEFRQPNLEQIARVESFMTDSLKLDGAIMPLSKIVAGKNLSLMARHITYPFTQLGEYAEFSKPEDALLLLNIFGKEGDSLVNVGFIDWEISSGVALCENLQKFIDPQNPYERLAADEFGFGFMINGFMVGEDFTNAGIGTFLAALSISTLNKLGVQQMLPGRLVTKDAKPIWKKFGLETPSNPVVPTSIPLLASHSYVTTSIAGFV